MSIKENVIVLPIFDGSEVVAEEVGQEEGEVEDKLLITITRASIGSSDI